MVVDAVILYPVQTASNLMAYESGYFGRADVRNLGLGMLMLTTWLPFWSCPTGPCWGCRSPRVETRTARWNCTTCLIISPASAGKQGVQPGASWRLRCGRKATMAEPIITCIEDLRVLAKRRVPRMFYDYADSGAWTESTYRANETDFQRIHLRQRVGIDFSNRTLASTMVGQPVSMPVALAPVGLTGMQHADGEILAARAAAAAGVPFTLSTMSICSIEDVAENTDKPFWFQLYVMKDRDFNDRLIGRAKAAGCSALVLTLDLQILGQRHKDIKNGLTAPPKMTLANIVDIATKPRWWMGMLGTKRRTFRNIVGHVQGVKDTRALGRLDGRAVRSDAELGRREAHQGPLGRQADPQGHSRSGGRRAGRRAAAPTR